MTLTSDSRGSVRSPDAKTGRRGYFNDIDGKWRYEDFFFEESLPYIEDTYRIKGEKRYRAIAGLSMTAATMTSCTRATPWCTSP